MVVLLLTLSSCVKYKSTTYSYYLNGTVTNIANVPIEGIRVIMHRSYSIKIKSDTTYTDAAGKHQNSMALDNKQRSFVVTYTDLTSYYRDTTILYSFTEDDENIVYDQDANSYTLTNKLQLPRRK